ncbi:hypothetical protein [Erwinia amylovora]|uniref:hypothetical protein n=1 Tax=Erwinia amylovora TaxID=552 RepID=UPI001951E4ED|nr:hypothetical protein [Erwinia amylovora]
MRTNEPRRKKKLTAAPFFTDSNTSAIYGIALALSDNPDIFSAIMPDVLADPAG